MTRGTYFGGTWGSPWGLGGEVYIDNHGRIYPQGYFGSAGLSISSGYTPDLEGFLTGPSVSRSFGRGLIQGNIGTSALPATTWMTGSRAGSSRSFGNRGLFPSPLSRDILTMQCRIEKLQESGSCPLSDIRDHRCAWLVGSQLLFSMLCAEGINAGGMARLDHGALRA